MHGYGFLHEACVPLWADVGARQLTRDLEVAAVAVGGGPEAGCMLLRKED